MSTHPELALLIVKASKGLSGLTPEERVRYNFILVTTFRRLESVYVQRQLGSIAPQHAEGFDRSALSILTSGGGAEWWQLAKPVFSTEFARHIDSQMASGRIRGIHPGFGGPE